MSKLNRTNRPHARPAVVAIAGAGALALAGPGHATDHINDERPPTRYAMPGAVLHVNPSFFDERTNTKFTFRVVQTGRRIKRGTLSITIPAAWRERASAGGPTRAALPLTGTAPSSRVKVRRIGRVVRFSFTNGRRNDTGRYTVTDRTLPPATYRNPFTWRVDGFEAGFGNASVLVLPDLTP